VLKPAHLKLSLNSSNHSAWSSLQLNNLSEWEKSKLHGISQQGVQCYLNGWSHFLQNPIQEVESFFCNLNPKMSKYLFQMTQLRFSYFHFHTAPVQFICHGHVGAGLFLCNLANILFPFPSSFPLFRRAKLHLSCTSSSSRLFTPVSYLKESKFPFFHQVLEVNFLAT